MTYWPRWALNRGAEAGLTKVGRHVLLAVSVYMNGAGRAWPTWDELQEKTGHSRAQIARALKELRDADILESSGSRGTGGSALYWPAKTTPLASQRRDASTDETPEETPGETPRGLTGETRKSQKKSQETTPLPPEGGRRRHQERYREDVLVWARGAGVQGASESVLRAYGQAQPWKIGEDAAAVAHFRAFAAQHFATTLAVDERQAA